MLRIPAEAPRQAPAARAWPSRRAAFVSALALYPADARASSYAVICYSSVKDALSRLVNEFRSSFRPSIPYRGQTGTNWLVSKVWSDDLRVWLKNTFARQHFEYPHRNGQRLDAALWFEKQAPKMDVALEWEWDNNKVDREFASGDFRKLLEVDACSGLAIVQTRADGRRGAGQAERTLERIRQSRASHRRDDRPVGVMEIRRTHHDEARVEFLWSFHDLDGGTTTLGQKWEYP